MGKREQRVVVYDWRFKEKRIEKFFRLARHPFADVQDAVEAERELRHKESGKSHKRLL